MIVYMTGKAIVSLVLAIALVPLGIRAAKAFYDGGHWLSHSTGWLKAIALATWLVAAVLAVLASWSSAQGEIDKRVKRHLLLGPRPQRELDVL